MTENSRNFFAMDRALLTIVVLAVIAIAGTFVFVPYFPQDPAYHQFADQRTLLGIGVAVVGRDRLVRRLRGYRAFAGDCTRSVRWPGAGKGHGIDNDRNRSCARPFAFGR